jgi:cold shock CspA family protein
MKKERKVGLLRSWNEARGFGIVRVGPPSSLERYFLHISRIRTGTATPAVNAIVHFDVSTKLVEDGKLQQAINADITDVQTAQVSSEVIPWAK